MMPKSLAPFMGKVFTHFSKPAKKFIEEYIYGIQASGDTKLSSIVRAIDDDTRPIYTTQLLPGFAELFDTYDG